MPLLKTISGMRGTVGGGPGDGFTPIDIVCVVSSYGRELVLRKDTPKVVVGRDGRMHGDAIQRLVIGTLQMCGVCVIDVDLSTTPTVAYTVLKSDAMGGIVITASHNPKEWNALKFLDEHGEFLSEQMIERLYKPFENQSIHFPSVDKVGKCIDYKTAITEHIDAALAHRLVDLENIKKKKFHIIADVINSTGARALRDLFNKLGASYALLNEHVTGDFAHDPEPVEKNLGELRRQVVARKADIGIAVDPDVDRLCFVTEKGDMFGEEYTLVAIADYVLQHKKGAVVSNLSSSQSLREVAAKYGVAYYASKVGEAHVVKEMKVRKAVVGGEGNGGIIMPDFHYGRDAIIGIGLFLSYLVQDKISCSALRNRYPEYAMFKDKIHLGKTIDLGDIIQHIKSTYPDATYDSEDGLKVIFSSTDWVHLRRSNTEPVVRILAESITKKNANNMINEMKKIISLVK